MIHWTAMNKLLLVPTLFAGIISCQNNPSVSQENNTPTEFEAIEETDTMEEVDSESYSLEMGHRLVYTKFHKDWNEEFRGREYYVMVKDTITGEENSIPLLIDWVNGLMPGGSKRYVLLVSITGSGAFCDVYKIDLEQKEEPYEIVSNKSGTEDVYPTSTGFIIDRMDFDTREPISEIYDFNGKLLKVKKR